MLTPKQQSDLTFDQAMETLRNSPCLGSLSLTPIPPHPASPMLMGKDFPSAPADSQATNPSPTPGNPQHPPLYEIKLSVFDLLNLFLKRWFISQDHLMKNIVEAQKGPNGKLFT
jgi:hypothetical protein